MSRGVNGVIALWVAASLSLACGNNKSTDPVSTAADPADAPVMARANVKLADAQPAADAAPRPATPPVNTPLQTLTTPPTKARPKMRDDIAIIVKRAEKLAGGKKVRALGPNNIPGIVVLEVESGVSRHGGPSFRSSLLVDGGKVLLHEKEAMRAVLKRTKDPEALATHCMFFVEGETNSSPIVDPSAVDSRPEFTALIKPPTLTKDSLEYWTFYGSPYRTVHKKRLRLASLELESVSASTLVKQALGPLAVARQGLQSGSQSTQRRAISKLSDGCKDIKGASALLLETMRSHSSAFARTEAGRAVKRCHDPGMLSTLIRILENDSDENVRMYAADTLGLLGDPSARQALEKAHGSTSAKVKGAAYRALKKLR